MADIRLATVESRFADIVWKNAPLTTLELIDLCAEELNWKRTTTYTVLKKLCLRGIFKTENSLVTVLIDRDEFYSLRSQQFVETHFQGSLPAFLTAFTNRRKLSEKELEQIRAMIDSLSKE